MKVLHVIRGLANSSGTTHIVVPLSEEMARQGCEVSVFHVEKDAEIAIEPNPLLVSGQGFPLSLPMNNPGVSWAFARELDVRITEFDVIHVHAVWNFPTWTAMRYARRAAIPYVVAPQGSFAPWALSENRWGKLIYGHLTERPLLQRADCLQALTATEEEQFRRAGLKAPVEVIPNGIDERNFAIDFEPLRNRLGLDRNQKALLFLSRLHPKKGLDNLIEAFARICRRRHDVTLVIAGHDSGSGFSDRVHTWIAERGLANRCRLIGEVRGEEKYRTLLGADAFVLPSYSEGLPVAALEAMAAGLPVVVTTRCNIPEVAEWEAGRIVEPTAHAIGHAIEQLLRDPVAAARLGMNGKRLVRAQFSWPRIAASLIAVYENLLSPRARRRLTARL